MTFSLPSPLSMLRVPFFVKHKRNKHRHTKIPPAAQATQPFKPYYQNSNSHLLSLYVFNRSSGQNLLKYQLDSSCVIRSSILMTTVFYKAVILQGEIWRWSLLGLKGLRSNFCKKYWKLQQCITDIKTTMSSIKVVRHHHHPSHQFYSLFVYLQTFSNMICSEYASRNHWT